MAVRSAHPLHVWEVRRREQQGAAGRSWSASTSATSPTHLLEAGVTLADPARIDVRGELHLRPRRLHRRQLRVRRPRRTRRRRQRRPELRAQGRAVVGTNARIAAFCHLDGAGIGEDSVIGPFARLRPGADARPRRAHRQLRRSEEQRPSPPTPRPTTSPTSATPRSAAGSTSAPAPSPATTTAPTSTAPSSRTTSSSAPTPSWWRRSPSAAAPRSAPAPR